VLAMKEIWTKDEAEYHGEFVNFDKVWSWPKPVTKPHTPVIIGGAGPRTLQRVVEYGDGWMPIAGRTGTQMAPMIAELQRMAKAAGRGHMPVSVFGAMPRQESIEQFAEMGVDRAIFVLSPVPAEEALPRLTKYAEAAASFGK